MRVGGITRASFWDALKLCRRLLPKVEPPLATEHVSPSVKNKILPADCPILMKHRLTSKGINLLTAPRDNRVCEAIMENGGF